VDTFPHPGEPANTILSFAGSASTVVLESEVFVPGNRIDGSSTIRTSFYAGGVGRRLELLRRCESGLGPGAGRIDVSGDLVAFVRCDNTLELRDLSGGGATQVVGRDVRGVRLAGRYVAWLEDDRSSPPSRAELVVYDRQAGAEAYRVPAASPASALGSFSLQADGKVALSFDPDPNDTNARSVVAWASPSRSSVHRLPLPRRYGYSLRLRNDELVFSRSSRDGNHEQLGVTGLSGHARLILRRSSGRGIDFDGRHIAYPIRDCRRWTVVRQPLSAKRHPSPRRCGTR
jgi:hypothetical protein